MENTQLQLLAELPGLEAAKQAIEARIEVIRRSLGGGFAPVQAEEEARPVDPLLGLDTLGRRIRRRHQSPELIAKRREHAEKMRAAKMAAIEARKKREAAEQKKEAVNAGKA